jgi:hypothetical protein
VKSNDNGTPPTSGGWKPTASTVTGRPVPSQPPVVPPPPMVRAPSAPRDRKPALAALGLLLVLVGALASVYLQQRAGDRVGVAEISKRVPQGQVVTARDLSEVLVAVDSSISYVTWAQVQRGALSGYTARTDLVPGTLLVGQMLTTALPLAAGQEVVALALKDGEYPLGIQVGDTVSAYYVTNKNNDKNGQAYLADGFTTVPIVVSVRVYDVGPVNPSGSLDVSLVLGQQYTNSIAQAASGGNLVLAFDKHTQ